LVQAAHLNSPKVELRYATLPSFLGWFAVHYWFVVFDEQGCHRWEVWQTKNAGGHSVGHLHCDLKPPDAGVGGGPARLAAQWSGAQALAIKKILEKAEAYPFCQKYRYWPGPNSNTFAAWVLRKARVEHKLGPMAFGKRYPVA
jgi:hypothetical protein